MINLSNRLNIFLIFWVLMSGQAYATVDESNQPDLLINSIRGAYNNLDGVKFLVSKVDYFEDYAYFCGVPLFKDGSPFKQNEFIAVYDMLMKRTAQGKWKPFANFNSFSPELDKVSCYLSKPIKNSLPKISEIDSCISIDKGATERKDILEAMREEKDQRFLVTRLCKTSTLAYFCGARVDKETGGYYGTDGAIKVFDIILKKNPKGQWSKVVDLGLFAMKPNEIKCQFGNEGVLLPSEVLQDAASKIKYNE
ncbi:hypothetical protein C9426_33720 [Serratia sp. S1B]|nr:hypothetical protein C9426_33720 [Serratia sp. S1B]